MASFVHRRAAATLVPEDSVKTFNFSRGKRGVHVYEEDKHMRDPFCFIYILKHGVNFSKN